MKKHWALSLFALLLAAPAWTQANGNNNLDLDGKPDLIVRGDMISKQWVVRDENLPSTACSVEEGGVTPGIRRIIRFTVMTPNIGDADLFVGDPNTHIAANDGLFEFATCHRHYHFRHYAKYELIDPESGKVWRAAKRGFCMLDTDPTPEPIGNEQPRDGNFKNCGAPGIAGNQGISHGWTDTYRFYLGGQYFVLDGGDGQEVVPPGDYLIRVTVNPPYVAQNGEPCRVLDATANLCHQIEESNYNNNVAEVKVTIPAHVGRSGYGPMAGTSPAKVENDEHDQKVK